MKKILLLILPVLVFFTACKKYPDGPLLSFNTKKHRVVNSWLIEKVLENGVDKTGDYQYAYKNFNLVTSKDNTYTLAYIVNNTFSYNEAGTWEFDNHKDRILFKNNSNSTGSSIGNNWEIYRLKEKEFWAKTQNSNGDDVEIHLTPLNP